MLISVIYWYHEANVTYIALFFDRTDWITGIYDSVEKPLFWKTNKNSIQSYQQLTTRGFSKKGKFGTFSTESFMVSRRRTSLGKRGNS